MKTQMMVTAYHLIASLASDLYESVGQRVMELIRNGLVASMPDRDQWEPKSVKIEIFLAPNHPLAPGKEPALVVLDHGCGLTDPAMVQYFNWLGTPIEHLLRNPSGSHGGASQKGIGRLAALACNRNCLIGEMSDRIKHGYYLLSRTSTSGNVRFVTVIPEKIETEQGFETDRFISPTSTEMGPLKGIRGSFTAIVIPTPIFTDHKEIYEAIKWLLPREQDKMFELLIGGKVVQPPPLQKDINITSADGCYRARLGVGNADTDGVWICDSDTAFRVASCQALGRLLPEPIYFPDLVGDIFGPGMLRYQNTSRSALAKEFTSRKGNAHKDWQRFMMFLIRDVVPSAKKLIERDPISGDAAQTVAELMEMFNERFGPPDEGSGGKPGTKKTDTPKPPEPNTEDPEPKEKEPREKYQRRVSIKVRDETYDLYRGQTLRDYIFAQVNPLNPKMILLNVRGGYKSLPSNKPARTEHCLMQILGAIGESKFPSDPYQAKLFSNEVRADFLK